MPYEACYLSPEGSLRKGLSEEEVRVAYESKQGMLWVDICEPTEEDGQFLERVFKFHHLAVEDCLSSRIHPPKIDNFEDYLFMVVHGINYAAESEIVVTAELALFLGSHFVVSNHNFPLYSVDAVSHLVESDARPMKRGTSFFTHALIDALIDNVLPTIDRMGEVTEEIEEEAIHRPHQSTMDTILKLRRSALRIHRVMAPQREVMNRLSRGEFAIIGNQAQIFFRDIYDHLVRIEELNQNIRDRADNAQATYLSSVANKQNETMKVLAMVATIFMPLTLLAGIYGMNFENMPELRWSWGYYAVIGLMGIVISVVAWRFWAKDWFTWGRQQVTRVRPFAIESEKLIGHITHLAKRPNIKK
ncbi:magnesium/cobalt transporter CorA [Chloroflexota bacterium]